MKLITVLIMVVLFCFSTVHADDGSMGAYRSFNTKVEESGLDWVGHVTAGAILSGVTYHYLPNDMNPWLKYGIAMAVPTVIMCIKEATDVNPDYGGDGVEWIAGGVIGIAVVKFRW